MSLLLFVTAAYYGVHIGEVYWRYYELLDAMRQEARMAPTLSDAAIRQRLTYKADSLIPGATPRFDIRRSDRPGRVTIKAEYSERVELPFVQRTLVLRPHAETTR